MASSNLSCFHMAPTSEFKGHESVPFKEGDVGIFGFGFLAISFIDFFVFVLKKIRFFGFGVSIGFFFFCGTFGFQFSEEIQAVFQM